MSLRLTIRRGSKVDRLTFDSLDEAIAELEREAEATRDRGGLPAVKMLRDYEPGDRVAARLEVSVGGMLRGSAAGVDVMGDGAVVPFAGGVRRRVLEPAEGESAYDAVRRALEGR